MPLKVGLGTGEHMGMWLKGATVKIYYEYSAMIKHEKVVRTFGKASCVVGDVLGSIPTCVLLFLLQKWRESYLENNFFIVYDKIIDL